MIVPIDYPLLGEPLLIELVNTVYTDRNGTFDYLGDITLAQGWLTAINDRLGAPITLEVAGTTMLKHLRDATRLLTTTSSPAPNPKRFADAIADINRAAALSPAAPQLQWNRNKPTLAPTARPNSLESLLSTLACDVIAVIAGNRAGAIETCSRPDCNMRFLRQHHRRRYCNERCASTDRQSRYYKRTAVAP